MKTKLFLYVGGMCFLILGLLGGNYASASVVNGSCIEDTKLGCTAKEVPLIGPTVNIIDGCDYPGDTATIELFFDADSNADRYDIGIWVSTDGDPNGDGSKSGLCAVADLDVPPADDLDADSCGDIDASSNFVGLSVGTMTVICNDADNDGNINVPMIMAWDQNAGGVCNGPMDTIPGTPSKCKSDLDYALPVPVPGQIIVEKQTDPDGDTTIFDFNLTGEGEDEDFTLTDDTTWESGGSNPILFAGEYTIVEYSESGWSLGTVSCTSNDGSAITYTASGAVVDLLAGDIVTCVFNNTIDAYCGDGNTDAGEACDDGANGDDTDGCDDLCEITTNGTCGSVDGTNIYDFDNSGDILSGGSANLCSIGTVTNFVYDTNTYAWTWDCEGDGGSTANCSASEERCGDDIDNGSEACDDGANGDDTDGCDDLCEITTNGSCGTVDGTDIYDFDNSGDALSDTSANLCAIGTVGSFVYDTGLHTWTWDCDGDGGSTASCDASEERCGDDIDNGNEECDDGADGDATDGCNDVCEVTTNGSCGTVDGTDIYDFDNSGDALSNTSANLCTIGTVGSFIYNAGLHTWTWDCEGDGGSTASCDASEERCGDTTTNGNEACDDGADGDATDGCNDACEITTNGSCGSVDGTSIYDFDNSGDALSNASNNLCTVGTVGSFVYNAGLHTWTWDCEGDGGSTVSCDASELRCGDDIDNGNEACDDGANGDDTDGCDDLCEITTNGSCGSVDGTNIYDFDNSGNSLTSSSANLCSVGTVGSFLYDTGLHTWTWDCEGDGGSTASCDASEERCGDDIPNGQEVCDDGADGDDADGCNDVCETTDNGACGTADGQTYYGENNLNQSSPTLCSVGAVTNFTGPDGDGAYSWICDGINGGSTDACSADENRCGDDTINGSETCDDGALNGQPNQCNNSCSGTTSSSCGNGAIEAGEACDDGNANSDTTPNACRTDCNLPVCGDTVVDTQYGEVCDDGNNNPTDGCNDVCETTTNGSCGTVDGTDIYDFDNSGDALSNTSANLCTVGTVGSFLYDTGLHTWTWDCEGDGGSTASCDASEERCGDDIDNGKEACDDGADGDATDGCNDACEITTNGSCGSIDGTSIYDFDNSGDALSNTSANLCTVGTVGSFSYDVGLHTWTWDCDGDGGSTASCDASEERCGDDIPNGKEACDDGANGDATDGCNDVCEVTDNGACGTIDGTSIYDFDNSGDILTNTSADLCDIGTVGNFIYDTNTHTWTWDCEGNGGSIISCDASEERCGDDIDNGQEACDDGANGDDTDGCNDVCETTDNAECGNVDGSTYYGQNNLSGSSIGLCTVGTVDVFAGPDTDGAYTWDCIGVNGGADSSCSADENRCGDDAINGSEICDDGALNGQPNQCNNSCSGTTSASCGNGTVEAGEICDEGTANSDSLADACRTDCSLPVCGDSVTDYGEECDDGNDNDTDACTNECLAPVCGDGIVQANERCDDGNNESGDGCSAICRTEGGSGGGGSSHFCGDGRLDIGETCDDGNNESGDGCDATCDIEEDSIPPELLDTGPSSPAPIASVPIPFTLPEKLYETGPDMSIFGFVTEEMYVRNIMARYLLKQKLN